MNKYKKLAMNTVIFAIGNFGSKILMLFLTKLYTGYISPADSGVKELLEVTTNFLIPVFTFSMTEAIIRYGLDKQYDNRRVFTSSCCITGIGLLIMILISPFLRLVPFLNFIEGYTVLLMVYVCTSAMRSLCSQFVRARGMVKLFSLDGILATITLFVFNVIFIAKLDLGVKGWMLAVILSDFLSALFLFITARLHRFLSAKYFSRVLSKSMLRFAVPLIPTTVMWVITGLSDRMFIRYMHSDTVQLGEATAGIYGYAAKIPNLISMVSTIFFQAWNMSAITENESEDRNIFYEKVYDSYQSILFIASAFLIAGVQIVTPIFIDTTTYPEYASVYLYTPVLVVAVMFMCLNQFFGSIYTATKHTNNSFWTSLVACIVNIILNVTLIPRYAIQGASVATLLSYLVCYFIRLYDARRYVPFKVNIKNFTVSMVVLIALCIAVVTQPPYYPLYLAVGFLLVLVLNYKAIFVMAKNILKRK